MGASPGASRVTPQFHAVDSQGSTLGGWDFVWIPGPFKGPKKKSYITNSWTLSDFLGKKTFVDILVFLLDNQFQFLFSENFGVWIFSFLFGASPKTCVALKSMGFLLQAAFPFKASLHTKQNAQFNFCRKFPPTNLPLQHPTFSPGVFFGAQKKGCSSTLLHPCFGPKWHAKCVLAADVGQIVNSLWHLAAGLSSGDVWGGGSFPTKKQKTSEFETHLFRLLTVNFRHGLGYTWILKVLLGIFVVSVSYVAKRTSL